MVTASKCPGCAHSLQAFLVRTPSGSELELGRCPHCGGFWGARGCLQRSFGPSALHQLIGGMTTRFCVECRIFMTPAVLPANIAVEVCSACHGMFLDAGELAQLGVRESNSPPARSGLPAPAGSRLPVVPPPPPLEAPEPPVEEVTPPVDTAGTFECVECGRRKPLRQGQALRDGLACRACMKARAEGQGSEDVGLMSLFRGRPRS